MIGCSTPRSRIESASAASDRRRRSACAAGRVGMDLPFSGCRAAGRSSSSGDDGVPRGTRRRRRAGRRPECSSGLRAHRASPPRAARPDGRRRAPASCRVADSRPAPARRPPRRTAPSAAGSARGRAARHNERVLDRAAADPARAPARQDRNQRGRWCAEALSEPPDRRRSSRIPWSDASSSALTGASTSSATTSALTVSSPRFGGVSITTSSYWSITGSSASLQEPFAAELADQAHLDASELAAARRSRRRHGRRPRSRPPRPRGRRARRRG